jgi:hypothetical protein
VGVDSNGDAEGAGESKVGNFDATSLVDEQILWLQVSGCETESFYSSNTFELKVPSGQIGYK